MEGHERVCAGTGGVEGSGSAAATSGATCASSSTEVHSSSRLLRCACFHFASHVSLLGLVSLSYVTCVPSDLAILRVGSMDRR